MTLDVKRLVAETEHICRFCHQLCTNPIGYGHLEITVWECRACNATFHVFWGSKDAHIFFVGQLYKSRIYWYKFDVRSNEWTLAVEPLQGDNPFTQTVVAQGCGSIDITPFNIAIKLPFMITFS